MDEDIAQSFLQYYQKLFTSANPIQTEMVLQAILSSVTVGMNASLVENFTRQEVVLALKQMSPLKAPGLDVLPPIFF